MKKNEAARLNTRGSQHLLICPVCRGGFSLDGSSLICRNRHCFDLSANGTLNLCYPPKKQDFKYSAERMKSRGVVIEHGFFDPLLGTLTALLNNAENTVVLDCGCGEGSMIKRLAANNNFTGIAADISKEAIALAAAGAYSGILWLVADAAALPLADESVDVILNILAPSNYSEFNRVLKRGGIIAKVIPGVNHLRELRERLSLTEYDNHDTAVLFKENLGSADETEISPPPFAVDDEMLRHVFNMTPMTENSDFDDVRGISAVSSNFKVLIYKKPARYEANDKN